MSIIRKRFASPNQYSWDAASAHKASRLSRLRRPQPCTMSKISSLMVSGIQSQWSPSAWAEHNKPSSNYWLCIPDTIKDEIFDIVHGDGYLDFYRDIRELRSS
jgi:hypothetical protein